MRGIKYLIDESGRRKAVQIDLSAWGKLWEDFYDVLVSEARRNEPTVAWDELKAEIPRKQEHRLCPAGKWISPP